MDEQSFQGQLVAGVDEVGRGPLVGDVVAAAVILPKEHKLSLMDSKKLTDKKRAVLDEMIRECAVSFSIGIANPKEIDELNILQASLLAMKRAVEGLRVVPELTLVDGNRLPNWSYPSKAIVKGDSLIPAISAASIIAKVFRDKQMIELDKEHPEYGFAAHKGYPTKHHLEAIKQYGVLESYRKSFKPVREILYP
jgi:ribonuclease HII